MASGTIKIYKGNIAAIPVNVSAANGSFSLAGVTMLFTVKLPTDSLSDDSAAVISKGITHHIDNTNMARIEAANKKRKMANPPSWFEHADFMSIIIGFLFVGILYIARRVADNMIERINKHDEAFISNERDHMDMKIGFTELKAEHDTIKDHCHKWGHQ